jgi:hypothetical protein
MKRLPKFCAAACLTLVLAVSAFGDGEIGCPYVPPPPPPPPVAQPETPVVAGFGDTLTQSALDLLQKVLSLG